MTNLLNYYKSIVVERLLRDCKYHTIMQVPCLKKITLNMGLGVKALDKKVLQRSLSDLCLISGQKPIVTKVRKSIANFKIRQGSAIGCKVTLRSARMWHFFEKFVSVVVPRIRDFRGFSRRSFDGKGNYNVGIKEHIIFPEIVYDTADYVYGMDISITTTAKFDKEGYLLLKYLNFPFQVF
ncbi:MAG: 50S ribosomal subunit protein L5 [Candidatus Westeberhardia cardiocondylae]|nr:50S ribosomal subunit protein L5 [Candidatus Westeberhardia cardiocondylae]